MDSTIKKVVLGAVLAGGLVMSGSTEGAERAGAVAGALSPGAIVKLKSADLAEVRAGLDDARLAGPRAVAAVPAVVELLRTGLPYPLAESALDTLGDIGAASATDAILPYADHRDVNVRRAAVRALTKTASHAPSAAAITVLRAALSDSDVRVRSIAATGLGSVKAKAAVPDLFLALDRRVYEAAASIGELCDAAECDALVGRVGTMPFDVMTTGVEPILFRPSAEVSDEAKLAIVTKLRALGTHDVNKFLVAVQGRWPKKASPKVKQEIDASVRATMASPGGDS